MGKAITDGYVSADGHVVEPADLWTIQMDKRFRDRAPRVESRPEADFYLIDGLAPLPVDLEGVMIEDKIAGELPLPWGTDTLIPDRGRGIHRHV